MFTETVFGLTSLNMMYQVKYAQTLQSMYSTVKSCVRVNGTLSEFFDSYMGFKQGEPFSPLLFIFFVNDMYSYLQTHSLDYLSVDELQIYILLFADDTVLFSYTEAWFTDCILLNKLHTYCNEWGITVNIDTTICMVFKKCNRVEQFDMFYNNNRQLYKSSLTWL